MAKRRMNAVVIAQISAHEAVNHAREEFKRVQAHLASVESQMKAMDEEANATAEDLTSTLLKEDSNWNYMFQKLCQYKEIHGDCDVRRKFPRQSKNPDQALEQSEDQQDTGEKNSDLVKLSQFVGRNRMEARKPMGHPERIELYKVVALDSIEFDWSPRDSSWMKNYEKLKDYMAENKSKSGKSIMSNKRKDPLGVWCNGQIFEFNKWQAGSPSYMTKKKIDLLNDIGFVWDRKSTLRGHSAGRP